MKRFWPLIFIFQSVLLTLGQQTSRVSTPAFTVSIPLNVNPETVRIHAGVYGRGLSLSEVQTKPGVYDYAINVSNSVVGPAKSLKLLLYIPGYRMVTSEFSDIDLQTGKIFIPPLVPLPKTEVKGLMVDSSEKPLADQTLSVDYSLIEAMAYFGYLDGSVPRLHIGSVKTGARGEFTINVPSLLDDPFFQSSRQFQLRSENGSWFRDQTLNPHSFPAQKTYEPLVVRKIQKGTLTGTLGKDFFRQNNLSDNLSVYVRPGDTIVTGIELYATANGSFFNANLNVDGAFEVQVPPGEYDLEVWVPGIEKHVPVQRRLVVEENKRRVFELP